MADIDALGHDALAEHDDLRAILADIPEEDWDRPTPAAGWTVRDQISHLAYFDSAAWLAMVDPDAFRAARAEAVADIEKFVAATLSYGEGIPGSELLDRFTDERRSLVEAAREMPDGVRIPWYGPDMSVPSKSPPASWRPGPTARTSPTHSASPAGRPIGSATCATSESGPGRSATAAVAWSRPRPRCGSSSSRRTEASGSGARPTPPTGSPDRPWTSRWW